MKKVTHSERTLWHRLLGRLLELVLTPLGVVVLVDFPLMSDPPRADILLLRRNTPHWTAEQLACLADGIRHTTATHVLLELKYTESLTLDRLDKVHGYDTFYRVGQNLSREEVASFILSAKTPQGNLLKQYNYQVTQWPGVYVSQSPMVKRVGVIILNELTATPHNAYFKVFASRQIEKQKAFGLLQSIQMLSYQLWTYLVGLQKLMLPQQGEVEMSIEITPEYVLQLGEKIRQTTLATYTVDEILAHYKPAEVLAHYKPAEVLAHYKPLESYLAERETQALCQGVLKSLQQILHFKLHISTEQWNRWHDSLKKLNLATLEQLNEVALTVETLSEFEVALKKVAQDLV